LFLDPGDRDTRDRRSQIPPRLQHQQQQQQHPHQNLQHHQQPIPQHHPHQQHVQQQAQHQIQQQQQQQHQMEQQNSSKSKRFSAQRQSRTEQSMPSQGVGTISQQNTSAGVSMGHVPNMIPVVTGSEHHQVPSPVPSFPQPPSYYEGRKFSYNKCSFNKNK
jgi:hypothetical protein